jgi:hypothetical protein
MSNATILKRTISRAITSLSARGLAWPAAMLARAAMRTAISKTPGEEKAGKNICVLLLPRSRFNDDALNTLKAIGSIEVLKLPRNVVKGIAAAFLPPEVDDNNYLPSPPSAEAAKLRYRAFLMRFWRYLDPDRRIEAVVTGNFGYYAEHELAAALEALGVPFIALHKENSWSVGSQEFWERIYRERRGPFLGRRILVYSPIERALQLRAGIADEKRIEVVGMPRLDEVHRWRQANIGAIPKPTVLFASFPPDVSMPVMRWLAPDNGAEGKPILADQSPEAQNLESLCRSAHRAILELAITCPDISVVVKTKGRARDRSIVLSYLGVRDGTELPSNLRVVHGGSPLPLLFEAAVVTGLHSTLLMEGLAAGRPVVVPWYGEVLDPHIARYVFDLGPAVIHAASPEALTDTLKRLARARTAVPGNLPPETVKILSEWLGNEDGRAGERAAAAIRRVIEFDSAFC